MFMKHTRREVTTSLIATALLVDMPRAWAQDLPRVTVSKDPTCGCCSGWVDHMRSAGFSVDVIETPEINRTKARLGVPHDLASCHTAEVGGYVIEGHVPAAEVHRLLSEKPNAKGLAVPGMPMSSPGMEMADMDADTYDVVLFGRFGHRAYARYEGSRLL
jgi:hypothetical protein